MYISSAHLKVLHLRINSYEGCFNMAASEVVILDAICFTTLNMRTHVNWELVENANKSERIL